jgi:hypothetical protein
MSYKYDVFISYASEDKDFVRPLAEVLRQQRIAVWFDEFELRPGVGLRQSIDRGLTGCRFGIVVLSPAFFAKAWPQWELDGLLQLQHSRRDQIIIPVWHKLDRSAIEQYSPSLANIVAVISGNDPIRTSQQVLTVLRPRPRAVEVARDRLVEFDFPVPVLSDDWWLDAAVWSAPSFAEGTFQEAGTWGWWGFPLPPLGDSAAEKGERIAWAAMQHSWQEAARERRITQCSEPLQVLKFIQEQPGLAETVEDELDFCCATLPSWRFRVVADSWNRRSSRPSTRPRTSFRRPGALPGGCYAIQPTVTYKLRVLRAATSGRMIQRARLLGQA